MDATSEFAGGPLAARGPARGTTVATIARLALREMRGGFSGFRVFVACIALGVAAIAGVGSLAASLADGLAREGRVILGGDLAFSLVQREASPAERDFLASLGRVSAVATLRAMARGTNGAAGLVERKAVDDSYPLYGRLRSAPEADSADLFALRGGAFGAIAEETLFARLGLKPGDRITIGAATIELRARLVSEPDKLASGLAFGPRLITGAAALRASGLLRPGSLVRWTYRVQLAGNASDSAVTAAVTAATARFPDSGWTIRTRAKASPQIERNIDRFTEFLTLVGLTALLVGGVGVANAVKSHLDRKRDVIAVFKALGASGLTVFGIELVQIVLFALAGSIIGLVVGAALPFAVKSAFGAAIPIPIAPALHPRTLALALAYGLVTALAFALWPLGRAHDIPAASLFREGVARERRFPRAGYAFAAGMAVLVLAGLAVGLAYDRRIALYFVAAAAVTVAALHLFAALVMALARRLPRPRDTALRLALANIHRPGALTPAVTLSLGLGIAVLVMLAMIEGNLRRQLTEALPARAPSFFFVDIQGAEADRFDAFIAAQAPGGAYERVPMLRGRIVAAGGRPAADLRPSADVAWVLQGDRGITYSRDVPPGSSVVAGSWWAPDYAGPPLVSLERRVAEGLGLALGDTIEVNVLGRSIAARIANLRQVDWQTLGINFVLVFSPNTFRGAPHAFIATLALPGGGNGAQEGALVRALAAEFPIVTAVRVKEALEALAALARNLTLGIGGASLIAMAAAMLVLGGALASGHRQRVYDAVILRTLGATRGRIVGTYALEYGMLGLAAAVFGLAAGSLAAALVVDEIMRFSFIWLPGRALIAALLALAVALGFGLAGTFAVLGHKPAPVLRSL